MSRLVLLVPAMALLWGCGEAPCPGGSDVNPDEPGSPTLSNFSLLYQLDGDPWTLVFSADFTDSDEDLGAGTASFYLNGQSQGTQLPLSDIFSQSGVEADATSGTVGVPLRFGDTLRNGARVLIGMDVTDLAGRRSNCEGLDLKFRVEPAP